MKKRLLILWSVLGLLIPYFLPASIVVAEEIETSRGIYFLSEPAEQVDFSTEKEQLSEIFQEEDWVFLNPINIRFYVEGQLDYQKYFPVFKDGDFHQLIDESSWQLAPSEVADFIQNHSKTTKPTSPMTFIIVNYAWYGFFDETWYDLYLNKPADLSELLSDLEETIIIRDLFTDYQDQVKQEQSNQKALESSQQSTSSREETNHDFSTSKESQENKQSEESKENVEGVSMDENSEDATSSDSDKSDKKSESDEEVYSEPNEVNGENSYTTVRHADFDELFRSNLQSDRGDKDYTNNLNLETDIRSERNQHTLLKQEAYFLVLSKDGKYSYGKTVYLPSSVGSISGSRFSHIGGELGAHRSRYKLSQSYYFKMHPKFFEFYKDVPKGYDPCADKDLNYFLNWINHWSEDEISIVEKEYMTLDHYVRRSNKGIDDRFEEKDHTKDLEVKSNNNVSGTQYLLLNEESYFLIRSKDGRYSYGKVINRMPPSRIKMERPRFTLTGGDPGANQIRYKSSQSYYFTMRPEFFEFYKDVPSGYDPCADKDLNYFLNWINHWSEDEISIVIPNSIDLLVAKKNNHIQPWRFFNEGRRSIKNQYFSLTLDETTRLDFDMRGRSGQRLTVYQENETKVFDRKYSGSNNTVTLDLPAGSYYIAMTDITAETTLQIRRHQFNDFQLSIDTNPERTHIYLNGVFHQELTDIYAPHHRPLQLPTAVSVSNKLNSIWRTSRGSHPVLDAMFGKNYLLGTNLREQTFPNVGNLPLGSTSLSAPLQYVGNGQFYTDAQIVNFGPQQRFVITGSTLLLAMAGTLVVYYAAHLIHTNQLQLTTPSIFREFETGSWEELEKFTYHGIVSYEGKTYGVNDETGEIKNTETGEELPKSVIPDDIRKSAAGASKLAIYKILADLDELGIDNIEDEYEWYTFKDLVQDELEGQGNKRGHTIEKHVMKSDAYLKNRLNTDNLLFSSTYYGVVEALIAINVTKLKHPEVFQNVGKQKGQFVDTPFALGKGYNSNNVPWSPLRNNQLFLMPSSSEKGFRVLTSYPVYKMGD